MPTGQWSECQGLFLTQLAALKLVSTCCEPAGVCVERGKVSLSELGVGGKRGVFCRGGKGVMIRFYSSRADILLLELMGTIADRWRSYALGQSLLTVTTVNHAIGYKDFLCFPPPLPASPRLQPLSFSKQLLPASASAPPPPPPPPPPAPLPPPLPTRTPPRPPPR